jgi:hypothetical protein
MHVKLLTLSSSSSILQSKSLQRRRGNMQQKLPLWPEEQQLNIWESFDSETQRIVIDMLSRLIGKAVRPEPREENHER